MGAQVPLVIALDDLGAAPGLVGGKGASLARIARAGFRVPPGFHVTTSAYHDFIGRGGLREPVLAAISAVDVSDAATFDAAAARIGDLFADQPVPTPTAAAIAGAYACLGDEVCGNATMFLHSGDRIRVDGGNGTVEVLHQACDERRTLRTRCAPGHRGRCAATSETPRPGGRDDPVAPRLRCPPAGITAAGTSAAKGAVVAKRKAVIYLWPDGLTMAHSPEPPPGRVETPDDGRRHASARSGYWPGR